MRVRREPSLDRLKWWVRGACLVSVLLIGSSLWTASAAPPAAYLKEYPIIVDATALDPPTRWQVPGVTPMIMTLDPETSDAYRTTERKELKLKPGKYRFGTFTFDFPFTVTLDGVLEFAQSLDQCVEGRGTQTLTVRCTRTVPYGGQRDWEY
ncbi:MAG: hypothetical protein AB1555_08580 [Nitrospirota bacterium]